MGRHSGKLCGPCWHNAQGSTAATFYLRYRQRLRKEARRQQRRARKWSIRGNLKNAQRVQVDDVDCSGQAHYAHVALQRHLRRLREGRGGGVVQLYCFGGCAGVTCSTESRKVRERSRAPSACSQLQRYTVRSEECMTWASTAAWSCSATHTTCAAA